MSDTKNRIVCTDTGPYKVEAGTPLFDHEGNPIETREGKAFFLCRCGASSNKPFCDGAHNKIEWDGALGGR